MNDQPKLSLAESILAIVMYYLEEREQQEIEHSDIADSQGCSCHISPPCSFCTSKPQDFDEFRDELVQKIQKEIANHHE